MLFTLPFSEKLMHIQSMLIDVLKPYANNPRQNAAAIDKVAHSIENFGFKQPIVVDKAGVIIVGHTRYLAAKQLNLSHVPVLVADDLTPEQAKAYRLADNRTHEASSWAMDRLVEEIAALSESAVDLSVTGFDAQEIAGLMAMAEAVERGLIDEDEVDVVRQDPITKRGELWQLGRHRVMCGDSTDRLHVKTLLEGNLADMVFTDPPYNVNYEGCTVEQLKMVNDQLSDAQFEQLLHQTFAVLQTVIKKTASLYLCHGWTSQRAFQTALETHGFAIRNQLIWAKHHFAQNFGRYKFQHEPIFYCHLKEEADRWYGNKSQTTLWMFNKPASNRAHPTMKPVALIEKALMNSSQAGDSVLDVFGGSGSTLIACEKTARTAYLMEIDPQYVDVSLHRWESFTGKTAILLHSSKST